jgi:hypothetical protein
MIDETTIDRHVGEVIEAVINAIQETKQAVWQASTPERRRELNELKSWLAGQLATLTEAEERINGRSPSITTPSGHNPRNLLAESHNDRETFKALIVQEMRAMSADVRARAGEIAGAPEADLFVALAEGLDHRLDSLVSEA